MKIKVFLKEMILPAFWIFFLMALYTDNNKINSIKSRENKNLQSPANLIDNRLKTTLYDTKAAGAETIAAINGKRQDIK